MPARRLVVGLGNPGDRYRHTRHNVGFRVVEELAERWRLDWRTDLCSARFAAGRPADLAAPQTYMNRSGWSVRCLVERYGYEPAALLIVFDDVALPLGTIRMRGRGRPAGHRGLESVIESLRTAEIPRLRVGVGPREGEVGGELAEYVLDEFGKDEEELVARVVARAAEAVASWIERGLGETMNEFNGEVVATGA
ncbi:MAG TPA: aminoacyl-tRNA hydrolase [Thermoanaerobaculia bacterium]|nr:aminoacyl-tRNA hydrolase [Thermoanaerobaculia bacterium]